MLKGVDIEIEEGEFVSIMGKSTLLNILSSLDMADKGRIVFEERDISKLSEEEAAKLRRKSFGFVFRLRKISEYILLLK